MAKKNEIPAQAGGETTGAVAAPSGEAAAAPSQRERYRSRRKESYPDLSEDDEEGWYGRANADLDELEGFRKNNEELANVFNQTPTLAGMLLAAKEGENPFVYLAEQAGPDLDIRELVNDPDFGAKMSQALVKFQERQVKSAQAKAEIRNNYQQSFAALKEIQQERGMSNEDCMALVEKMFGKTDDENDGGIIGNASKGIVPREIWEAVLKAEHYDDDIASAREQAGAQAMNQRIQNPLKTFDDSNMPPTLNAGGAGAGDQQPKKRSSFFSDWEREEGV